MCSEEKSLLIQKLSEIEHVSIISKVISIGMKRFLGMTVHWIDPESFEQQTHAICFKEFNSSDQFNSMVLDVNRDFGIQNKVLEQLTSQTIDFKSSFKALGLLSDGDQAVTEHSNQHPATNEDVDSSGSSCHSDDESSPASDASHLLRLVLMTGFNRALKYPSFDKICRSTMRKLNDLFRLSKRIDAHETFKTHNILVKPPVESQWESLYAGIKSVLMYDLQLINTVMIELNAPEFTANEYAFLKDFIVATEPITKSLNHLQSNKLYAVVLPKLKKLRKDLEKAQNDGALKDCAPLARVMYIEFLDRFKDLMTFDTENETCVNATIAACTHPFFKLRWIDAYFMGQNYSEQRLPAITSLLVSTAAKCTPNFNPNSDDDYMDEDQFPYSFEDSQSSQQNNNNQSIEMEVIEYFKTPSSGEENDLLQLNKFPNIHRIFMKFNTMLTSSAAADQMLPINSEFFHCRAEFKL